LNVQSLQNTVVYVDTTQISFLIEDISWFCSLKVYAEVKRGFQIMTLCACL